MQAAALGTDIRFASFHHRRVKTLYEGRTAITPAPIRDLRTVLGAGGIPVNETLAASELLADGVSSVGWIWGHYGFPVHITRCCIGS